MATLDHEVIIRDNYPALGIKRGDNLKEALEGLSTAVSRPDPVDFTIGDGQAGTPSAGSNEYNNTNLAGKRWYVLKAGFGKLRKGTDYAELPTGGFRFLQVGDVFSLGESFSIIYI